ncbi:hypothetical protein [Streptomyces tubercidicus]|uniref:hypothetical protein n=1 Tax=Streptomyces tubercidicus TaxID=47759 RepID=UPI001FE7502E|nr:hypothetical protein [Streptomyces tubercidicus]
MPDEFIGRDAVLLKGSFLVQFVGVQRALPQGNFVDAAAPVLAVEVGDLLRPNCSPSEAVHACRC